VFKNPENAGMVRKISFRAKSYLFNLHEMFKNSGSVHLVQKQNKTVHWPYVRGMKRCIFTESKKYVLHT
jgi:hypothetical protein